MRPSTRLGRVCSSPLLREGPGGDFLKIDVVVEGGHLTISIEGEETVRCNLGFWKFRNYFKAGSYPQATEGAADVVFRRFTVRGILFRPWQFFSPKQYVRL
ncbi:MAG: hypothetical protein JHD33_08180 [Chthoniobacterales bacterium]|nr:hypothetical protein [Chthoniobacterales bacterium]